jgi:hypothetical protein
VGDVRAIGAMPKVQGEGDKRPRVHYVPLHGRAGDVIRMCTRIIDTPPGSLQSPIKWEITRESISWEIGKSDELAVRQL